MAENDIELKIGIDASYLEASIQKVLGRVQSSPGLKFKSLPKSPFTSFGKEKTQVGKVHLDPLKKPKDPGKSLTTDNLKRLLRLWKIDLIWKWIKGTWNTLLRTNPILESLMQIFNAIVSLISMALLFPFLDDIIEGLKVLLKESVNFFNWMKGFKGLDISEIPTRIADGINAFFDKIEWGEVGTEIGKTISGVIETVKKTIEEINWDKIGTSIGEFFSTTVTNINWFGIGMIIADGFIAGLKTIGGIVKGLWEGSIKKGQQMTEDLGKRLGKKPEEVTIWDKFFPGWDRPPSLFLANGGVVTKPTEAVIGDEGPEAVIPLDQMKGMGGTSITINGMVDEYKFRSIVREEIEKSNRRLYNVRGPVGI